MELLAISLGGLKPVDYRGRKVLTGIYKEPVTGPVQVEATGLVGDQQADRANHGGKDKAIYVYSLDNYRWWEAELGHTLSFGQFGENFTVSGMTDDAVHIGDVFAIGNLEVQVTQPRVPCYKLGIKMGDPGFVARFHASGRVGFYLRVLKPGEVQAGDRIERLQTDPGCLAVRDAMLALGENPRQNEIIERALAIPALSQAWRIDLQKRRDR